MKITAQQVLEKFGGRFPQIIWDNVFLPAGADGISGDSEPMAFRYHRLPSGKISAARDNTINLERVSVEGYSLRLINIAGRGLTFWVRSDLCPKNPAQSPSIQITQWSEELDFGKRA